MDIMKVQYLIDDLVKEKAVQYLRAAVPDFFKKYKDETQQGYFIDKRNKRNPKTNAYIQTWQYFRKERATVGEWVDFIEFELSEERIEAYEHPFNNQTIDGFDIEIKSKLIITYLLPTK